MKRRFVISSTLVFVGCLFLLIKCIPPTAEKETHNRSTNRKDTGGLSENKKEGDLNHLPVADPVRRTRSSPLPNPELATETTDLLIEEYKSIPELINRLGVISDLCQAGGDRVEELFQFTLLEEFNGKVLSERETEVMKILATRFGILSQKSQSAYSFLTNGTELAFWQNNRRWTRAIEDEFVNNELVNACISALGFSSNPDVSAMIERLTTKDQKFLKRFNGSIVQAKFHQTLISKYGFDRAADLLSDGDTSIDEFMKWSESEEGLVWGAWASGAEATK